MLQNYSMLFEFMEVLGKKWIAPLLIFLLLYEKTNFNTMKKRLRLTSRGLSKKLKLLEALGLIEKIAIENPKQALYSLSSKGKEISELLMGFAMHISK